jgi:protein gp37
MNISKIPWTHGTWNPWIGCHAVSPECAGCYARADREKKGCDFSTLVLTSTWNAPYTLNALAGRQGCCAFMFASSLTDWFHHDADGWREDAWSVVRECKNLIWLVLSKRIKDAEACLPEDWTENFNHVWLGTTVGHRSSLGRVDALRQIPCSKRFLSIEPLLEDISTELDLDGIGWALVGGMSGELWQEKQMRIEWAASLYDLTRRTGTPFFFKQASTGKSEQGSNALGLHLAERQGLTADPKTVDLVREVPETPLPLLPLNREKGRRFSVKEWHRYQEQ